MQAKAITAAAILLAAIVLAGCTKPRAKPAAAAAAKPAGTAIVFVAPAGQRCDPCEYLKADLAWLIREHGWQEADWQIRPTNSGTTPRIVYFLDDKTVGEIIGYSVGTWQERKPQLLQICKSHPNWEAE